MAGAATLRAGKRRAVAGELVIDNFAGGGGASTGIAWAIGRDPDYAINHNAAALAMHRANHPGTVHLCEDAWSVDPRTVTGGAPVGLAWFSPDCRHFSRAKGCKPVERRIRGLAWVAVKWAKHVRPGVIILENVREFETWGPLLPNNRPDPAKKGVTFRRFVGCLRGQGYAVEWGVLDAADFGAPTHRRRLFLVARCDGKPIYWPSPTHGPARPEPWRTAAECIDWSLPMRSIFNRKKPLADKTLRRIAMGIKRYVLDAAKPFIVQVNHGGDEFRGQGTNRPMPTVSGKHGFGIVAPSLVEVQNAKWGGGSRAADRPLQTITANPKGGGIAIVGVHLVSGYGEREGQQPRTREINRPAPVVVPAGKHSLVAAFLTKYYGTAIGADAGVPLPTATQKARFGIVVVVLEGGREEPAVMLNVEGYGLCLIVDIQLRMFSPRELARCQGFPDDYVFTDTSKADQVARIGNSVPPYLAEAMVTANFVEESVPDDADNPFRKYRRDADRVASMLEEVAALGGPGRLPGHERGRYKSPLVTLTHMHEAAMLRVATGAKMSLALEVARMHNGKDPFGQYLVRDGESPTPKYSPLKKWHRRSGYFDNRALSIRLCGRNAVGVALTPGKGESPPGERVFHAACRDRLCPICSARGNAHGAAGIGKLMVKTLNEGGRLFFFTLTIQHVKADTIGEVYAALNRAWALFIRRKIFRDTWLERLRTTEIEYTKKSGWHIHFHGLALLSPDCKLAKGERIRLERAMKDAWVSVTARQDRPSYEVDFRELVPHRKEVTDGKDGDVCEIRYWIRPGAVPAMRRAENRGSVRLHEGDGLQGAPGHVYRVQSIGEVCNELCKYITKRGGDGKKENQVPFWKWHARMLHAYAMAVRHKNLRRASTGWASVLLEFNEQQLLAKEIEQAKDEGADYYSWAEIVDDCRRAGTGRMDRQAMLDFGNVYPRILKALDREGCDVAADSIRGWVSQALDPGNDEPKQTLRISPWQRGERHAETTSERMEREGRGHLHARHFRVLVHMHRCERKGAFARAPNPPPESRGRQARPLRRFAMSKQRMDKTLYDLAADLLIEVSDGCYVLTDRGKAVIASASSRPLDKDRTRAERRAQHDLWAKQEATP